MIFTSAILKERKFMLKLIQEIQFKEGFFHNLKKHLFSAETNAAPSSFQVMVRKEISDQVRSWRFLVLLFLILLTCFGSLYTSVTNLDNALKQDNAEKGFLFLKLFTVSDGTLPPFHVFIGFLGPLLGIALGFDAVNSEQNRGTLSRILSQPIHRDYVINSKFVSALIVISVLFFSLGFMVMGLGLIIIGIPPSASEFLRIIFFLCISICYTAFWLNLSILFSIRFKQAATSALTAIAVWLFFTIFYQIIINVAARLFIPQHPVTPQEAIGWQEFFMNLLRLAPSQLFSDASITLLLPSVRSLGPLTMEQMYGALPSPLPLGQSLLLVWPQLTGLTAATAACFAVSYYLFMRKEIRPR